MLNVVRYEPALRAAWDRLVRESRNGVFLFERGYLDYHAERFDDASLVVQRGDEPVALLPAHRAGNVWVSHGGLSFGGLVMHARCGAQAVREVFDVLLEALRARGATRLTYRPVPHAFHRQPSEDDLYVLHRLGARTARVDLSSVIDLARRPPLAKGRRHALSKARRAGVEVRASGDYAGFWPLLVRVLDARHAVAPAHSAAEIEQLAGRFDRIRLYCAYRGAELLAGAVIYRYDGVLHTQYLAASEAGREHGALDALIAHLLAHACESARWFSFGASTHCEGRLLNAGLLAQKEMFGGRGMVSQTLELELA